MSRRGAFTVSGGTIDRNGYESGDVALSAAITFASRERVDRTLYVRDGAGVAYGRVEAEDGRVRVYRTAAAR